MRVPAVVHPSIRARPVRAYRTNRAPLSEGASSRDAAGPALLTGRQLGDEIGAFIGIHTPFHDRDTAAITSARPLGIDLYRELRASTQRHFGGQDGDTPADITEPRTVARDVTKALEAHTYPLAEHGFALFTVGDWRRAHAARTCTLAGALLRRHLPAI